ncbi:hypothetical protein SXIM_18830 [Streptomyces xiamenensis]|uniref:Uncharacterized protein n=1 Tax=Streptomyces xiamenensis TaxID=408015 RepID=A0A0F7FT98_9ACTN|nr:hypothetical protein SXIM_18830 [Streptomyces xiamenensis]
MARGARPGQGVADAARDGAAGPGERVAGEVYWHTDHNHQVLLRLDAWT